MLDNLVLGDEGLSLSINGVATRFDYFWLRDNARDPVSFDSRSHQRELFTAALDPHIKPTAGQLNGNARQIIMDGRALIFQPRRDARAIHHDGFPAFCRIINAKQRLYAGGIMAVGAVGMRAQLLWRIGGIGHILIRLKFKQTTKYGLTHIPYGFR